MTGAKTPILHGVCQGDFDLAGFKLLNADLSALPSGAPFSDETGLIRSSTEATALAHFKLDWTTPGVHRVFTLPNYDGILATRAGVEALTNKTLNGLTFGGTGGFSLTDAVVSITGTLVFDGDFSVLGSGATCALLLSADTTLTLPVSGTVATTSQLPVISDIAYNATTWNANLDGATKNAIRDKFESLITAPFSDATILFYNSVEPTKTFKFSGSGITYATTRTMTVPDKNGTLAMLDDLPDLADIIFDADIADRILYLAGNVSFFAPFTLTGGLAILTAQVGGSQVTLPASGTLATVAATIPFSYLDSNKELGGLTTSDAKVATQKAVKSYVDARTGRVIPPDNDGQVQSATVVDLVNQPYQLEVLGTTTIDAFTMEAGDEHILVFEGVLDLTDSELLILPGGADITTAAGDYAVIHETAGATKVSHFQKAVGHVADLVGGSVEFLARLGFASGDTGFQLLLSTPGTLTNNRTLTIDPVNGHRVLTLASDFSTAGSFALTLTQTGATNVTLPTTGTLSTLAGAEAFTNKTGFNGVKLYSGAGSPETVVTAPVGSFYSRTDGGANTTFYVKESGTGNTGWIAMRGVSGSDLLPIYVKNVPVLTAGAPADIASISLPAGITRWRIGGGNTVGTAGGTVFAETASGTLAGASFTAFDASGGTGLTLTTTVAGPTLAGIGGGVAEQCCFHYFN